MINIFLKLISFRREQFDHFGFLNEAMPIVKERHTFCRGPFGGSPFTLLNKITKPIVVTRMYILKLGLNVLNAVLLTGVFLMLSNCQL